MDAICQLRKERGMRVVKGNRTALVKVLNSNIIFSEIIQSMSWG
jgi:hypothetical protein